MDPYEIEDTSDWVGCPSQLETVKHYASMLEEDLQALKREAQPDDIAGAIAFLASDAARWVSGDTLRVDGGSKL